MAWKIVDYLDWYAANVLPVIPAGATLSPHSKIKPDSAGKVPGVLGDDGWHGVPWRTMQPPGPKRAVRWDEQGAGLGFRCGPNGVAAIDLDITDRVDCLRARKLVTSILGDVPLRRVDHPDHVKVLFAFRVDGAVLMNVDLAFKQSDGDPGKIQLLSAGRYFNVHGIHPGRRAPYVWPGLDPADAILPLIPATKIQATMKALGEAFSAGLVLPGRTPSETDRKPETCDAEEAAWLLSHIPNDESFTYDPFVAMGAAIHGASGGAEWGRQLWLDWCRQVPQGDPDKPEDFWTTMHDPRIGAEMLRRWAQERQPQLMAATDFADDIDQPALDEAAADKDLGDAFLNGWFLVGASTFYRNPDLKTYSVQAFALLMNKHEKRLRRHFGEKASVRAPEIFARHTLHDLRSTIFMPGSGRIVERNGCAYLNLWTPLPRPLKGRPLSQPAIDVYLDLVRFVLGGDEPAALWLKWHAFMLQVSDRPPGWHWLVQGPQGLGKDLMLRPFAKTHGDHHAAIDAKVLAGAFNAYSEKRLVNVSEMRERATVDIYTGLKSLTSGADMVMIHRKYHDEYQAKNVMGLVIFSNETHPLRMPAEDRRFHVVENLDAAKRPPEYYARTAKVLDAYADDIAEFCWRMVLTDDDLALLHGDAPATAAKLIVGEVGWEREVREIVAELESEVSPDRYLPVATTGDIKKWLIDRGVNERELPNRIDFVDDLYRLGVRPLVPVAKSPKRPEVIRGHRLWRLAKTWRDQRGVEWNVDQIARSHGGPQRLAKLYTDHTMPAPEFKAVDDDQQEI